MSNLPPGAATDPNAPWNQREPPFCDECENYIVEADDHDPWCPDRGMDGVDMEKAEYEAAQEAKFDALREEGKL